MCHHRDPPPQPHSLAEGLGVLLHLLEDEAHGGVAHDLLHLGVGHGAPLHLLGVVVAVVLSQQAALVTLSRLLRGGEEGQKGGMGMMKIQQP